MFPAIPPLQYLSRFKQLEYLCVGGCEQVGNNFVKNLLPHPDAKNKVLKELSFVGCQQLRGRRLSQFESLETLNISDCRLLTDKFAEYLPSSVRKLFAANVPFSPDLLAALKSRIVVIA